MWGLTETGFKGDRDQPRQASRETGIKGDRDQGWQGSTETEINRDKEQRRQGLRGTEINGNGDQQRQRSTETGINGDGIGGDVNQQRRVGSLCLYIYKYSLPNCLAKITRQSGSLYIYLCISTLGAYPLPNCLAKNTRQSGSLHIQYIYIFTCGDSQRQGSTEIGINRNRDQ